MRGSGKGIVIHNRLPDFLCQFPVGGSFFLLVSRRILVFVVGGIVRLLP
jgi:hypothetical protein